LQEKLTDVAEALAVSIEVHRLDDGVM